ncbi:uncharacterized protein LOC135124489 [Zophobas morio]|uniref:uncharacterized protein LOC135124489 n=1 Tax=Zophobas morio TaxID=2755281 RepID=UPI00308370E0
MLVIVVLLFCLCQTNCYRPNPNNYAELDIHFIAEDFDRKIGGTYYDILVLKVHINVNAQFVENAIDEEIVRLIDNENDTRCRQLLQVFKNKAREDCQMELDFDLLEKTRAKFAQLKEVACSTLEICGELNPLLTQGENLEKCELSKIVDLRRQSVLVNEEFQQAKKKLFEDHDHCIRDLMGSVFANIAQIVYGTCRKLE